ncbi:MAG: ankyrin repeat domain-containing protein [Phycisphaeraceae bacterium]
MREDLAELCQQAIDRGDEAALDKLLSREPRLTGTAIPVQRDWGEEQWLPLHLAAKAGALPLVERLIEAGASIDSRTRFRTPMHGRETPLHLASRCGHDAIVARLLDAHAAPGLLDANHRSALTGASQAGHLGIVARLVDAGAPLDPVDDSGRTPLHWAIAEGHVDVSLGLIAAGADPDHACPKEPAGYTALHRCAISGEAMQAVADALVAAGADATLRDPRFDKTAADLLAEA